ncbi:MAG TPA: hypothetical protein VGM18_12605 [Candidatus Sulfotelmatobacter sp.]|jgi:hypothetical protein
MKAGLLGVSLLVLSGSLLAQRAGGFHGGAVGLNPGHGGRGVSARGFHRRNGAGSAFLPYYDMVGNESDAEAVPDASQPIMMQRVAAPPTPNAQVIEVPAVAISNAPKVLPPAAIFVLTSGERLESRRFVLTASVLSVSIDREPRNVPMESVDISATVAANHARGIELRIPDDGNEVSLGF